MLIGQSVESGHTSERLVLALQHILTSTCLELHVGAKPLEVPVSTATDTSWPWEGHSFDLARIMLSPKQKCQELLSPSFWVLSLIASCCGSSLASTFSSSPYPGLQPISKVSALDPSFPISPLLKSPHFPFQITFSVGLISGSAKGLVWAQTITPLHWQISALSMTGIVQRRPL